MAEKELTNMKLTQAEAKDTECPCKPEMPEYPWGLQLDLNNDVLQKLGISLPQVGTTLLLHARAEVKRVSASDEMGGEKRMSVTLQITDMALMPEVKRPTTKTVLFEKGG